MNIQNPTRVLIAEDDYLVSNAVVHILKNIGYESIEIASTGSEAVEMTNSLNPDVILMDIRMPEMDGFEATQKIQETCPTPVVILSAHLSDELIEKASDMGVSAYLLKPPVHDEIDRAIRLAIARHGDIMKLRRLNKELEDEINLRKETERHLRASDRTHRTLAKNLPGIVYRVLIRENNRMLFFNDMVEQLTGYRSDELSNGEDYSLENLILEEDRERVVSEVKQAIRVEKPFEIEYRMQRKSKEVCYFIERGRIVPGSDGKPKYIDGVIFDETERKQMEKVQHSLYKISDAANKSENLQQLYEVIHSSIAELMPAKNFYIALHDVNRNEIHYPYYVDEKNEKPSPIKLEKGITVNVLKTGKSMLLNKVDLINLKNEGEIEIKGTLPFNWVGIPLKTKDNVIGAIAVQSYDKDIKYNEKDRKVLVFVSEQIAMAIEHVRSDEEIKRTRDQLRNLSAHLQEIREEEKIKMTYGIREDFSQILSVVRMDLRWLDKKLSSGMKTEHEKITSMIDLIDSLGKDVQKVSSELRPSYLDHLGVNIAIKYYTDEFQKRTGIKCKRIFEPEEIDLSKNLSVTLYRILEEVLDNVEKHAKASNVKIKVKVNEEKLLMCITDDGIGIQEEKINDSRSLGLLGIKERLLPFDGNVIIRGFLNRGTKVVVNIPIKNAGN